MLLTERDNMKSVTIQVCEKTYKKLRKIAIKEGLVKKNGSPHMGKVTNKIIECFLSVHGK